MRFYLFALLAVASACGQAPSFIDHSAKRSASTGGSANAKGSGASAADATTAGDAPGADGNVALPSANSTGTSASTGTANATPADPPPDIPAAAPTDLDALHKCLAQWQNNPFTGTVQNYKKINAAITVGGFGNAINDTDDTPGPFLILVDAGVNVLGSPVYNLLNRNGYYCIKVNVNVLTNLTVNLHCNARLADERVDVNVLSTQNDATSSVGVHVLSNVQVNEIRPQGDTCIR